MANRDMKVSVLVQLVDRLTAPLRGIQRGISGVARGIGDIGRRIGVIGGALAALSFMAPIQQAAAWDAQLRDIAITAGKTGGAVESMIAESGKRYEALALQVGQSSQNLAKGAQLLIAAGMDSGLIDKLMPTIGRVSTAANAELSDTAKTAFALNETLKIGSDQMELALAKLVTAGKLGRFEFKNMASEFPGLTAQMAKLGVTGMEAVNFLGASLQTAMLGTDSPSEAANNLKNFLTKINAPEAIKKFEKELKVDVTGVMTDATAKGINPVEAVIQKMTDKLKVPKAEIDKILKTAGKSGMSDKDQEKEVRKRVEQLIQGTKVGRLYADMQVLDFLIPMLLNTAKFKEMKQQIAQAGIDVISEDFASRMRGLAPQMAMFGELGTQAMRRIGLAFAANLPMANRLLTWLLQTVALVDAKWPGLIDGTLSWTGSLLALGAAVAVLTPVVSALAGIMAALVSPFVLAGLVIAGAAAVIYRNWETLGPFFSTLFDNLRQIGRGFVDFWEGLFSSDFGRALDGIRTMWDGLTSVVSNAWQIIISTIRLALVEIDKLFGTDLAGAFQRLRDTASEVWDAMKAKLAEMVSSFQEFPAYIVATFAELVSGVRTRLDKLVSTIQQLPGSIMTALDGLAAQLRQAGADAIQALWDGMKAKVAELIAWVAQIPAMLVNAIGSFDFSSISIKWPSFKLPAIFGGGDQPAGAPAPATPAAPAPAGPRSYTGSPPDPFGNPTGFSPTSAPGGGIGGSRGFTQTAGGPAANQNVQVGGRIVVEAAEGSRIVNVQSENPAVPVTPNRGTMLGHA
jgi:hypothetical protein